MNNIGPNILVNLSILCQPISKKLFFVYEALLLLTEKFYPPRFFSPYNKTLRDVL